MSGAGWEGGPAPASPRPRRHVALLVVAAVALTGLLARPGGSQGTGTLDIDSAPSPSDSPQPEPSSIASPTPSPTPRPTRSRRPPRPTPSPTPTPEPASGRWDPLPDAPIDARGEHTAVWSGTELLVWGGVSDSLIGAARVFRSDGAALDPGRDAWRVLAPGPLEARSGHAAVWTGTEMVVWGGHGRHAMLGDGAAHDPATGEWRVLAPAPLSPRSNPAAVWTGGEMVVIGGHDNAGPLTDAAAYDPAADAWRPLPPLPESGGDPWAWAQSAIWIGTGVVVWSPEAGPRPGRPAVLDWATRRWTPLPDPPGDLPADSFYGAMVWTGETLLTLHANYQGNRKVLLAWTPGSQAWDELDGLPPTVEPWGMTGVWTGDRLLLVGNEPSSAGAVYRPARREWTRLPPPPTGGRWSATMTWTGDELVVWGGMGNGAVPIAGIAWRFDDVLGVDRP